MSKATIHARTLLVLLLFIAQFTATPGFHAVEEQNSNESSLAAGIQKLQPVGSIEYRVLDELVQGNMRRKLTPFQLCLACKCCAVTTDPASCATMPCCFGIDCQLPNKPYGVCAFVPKTCNCTTCAAV